MGFVGFGLRKCDRMCGRGGVLDEPTKLLRSKATAGERAWPRARMERGERNVRDWGGGGAAEGGREHEDPCTGFQ